ncbi:hypothetical protein [Algoriphagus resistens]|uniref:hypothetical protein n=1 Tax=Algoriphagus resistens TaxID=1750590 RepID=UPI0007168ADD|nr:hypothetical protein [Algoriphagus resistens]
MISITVDEELIDINDSASFSIGGKSPFVTPGELYGPKVYNVSALDSRSNARIFQFASLLPNTGRVKSYGNVQIRFADLLWKIGTLKLRDFSGAYNFSFHSDAGDIESRIKNRTLPAVDLGTDVSNMNVGDIYPAANHVYFTVKNPNFYGDKNPGFSGYVNLYNEGAGRLYNPTDDGDAYTITPFPFLLYVLDTIFKDLGYFGISGEWTQDENIRRVCIPNNYDHRTGTITYNSHVPPVSVGSFLIDVAISFGITYKVNPITRLVEIVRISDWLNDQSYTNFNNRANKGFKLEPNQNDGFRFWMREDGADELTQNNPAWMDIRVGNGSELVETNASPLTMITEDSPMGGEWTIPQMDQAGSGPAFELDLDSRGGLRFMLFDGMQTDSLGNAYPQGHYMRTGVSLRWSGTDGIINRCYQEWMDWKSYTEYMERTVDLNLVELLQLDTERKVMIDNLKWVVDEYDASISVKGNGDRIKTNLKLYSVKL